LIRSRKVVFLLGAGASVDAGFPTVAKLTQEFTAYLASWPDGSDFRPLFEAIAGYDSGVRTNYERLFEWLDVLINPRKRTLRNALSENLRVQAESAQRLAMDINLPICELLSACRTSSKGKLEYLAHLRDFANEVGTLKVFTLNYDMTVEDACRAAGMSFTTGFDERGWRPSLFESEAMLNLYKLHGSLSWFRTEDNSLVEVDPINCDQLPELVMGPGGKLQHDEPFVRLYFEFCQEIAQAESCVVIGCALQDDHVRNPICTAMRRGMKIIDVGPSEIGIRFPLYTRICQTAKVALENGLILPKLGW
jgi:hypothetical protein